MAMKLGQAAVSQIGIVVRDLEAAMEKYLRLASIGPWSIYTTGAPPLRCIYHGKPANYQIHLATARSGPVQMELIEYISGDTIHRDFLSSGREGVEHLGIFVNDLDEALKPYLEAGVGILQQADGLGVSGDGRYAYLDTESKMGTILELIQSSSEPQPPERVYPQFANTHQKGE